MGYWPAHDEVIAALNNRSARRVADIACGTGILADWIARQLRPDEIYGVDMSDGMLAQARARSSEVQWRKGPAEHLPFEDGTLDAVVTTSAFHFFDQPAALRDFHRVLAPGGLAAVATLSPRWHAPRCIGCPPVGSIPRTTRRPPRCGHSSKAPAFTSAINIASVARRGRGYFRT